MNNNTPAIIQLNQRPRAHSTDLEIQLPQAEAKALAWVPHPTATGRAVSIILAASSGLLLTDLDRDTRRELVITELHKCAMRLGHKQSMLDPLEARALRDDLTSTLLTLHPRLTVPEFQLVLMLGATGELSEAGEWSGLNLRCLSAWFRRYASADRPEAMRQASPPVALQPEPAARNYCELPPDHPVHLAAFAHQIAGFCADRAAKKPLPPLLLATSFAYNRLREMGCICQATTGYSRAASEALLERQAGRVAAAKPRGTRQGEEWAAFKAGYEAGALPLGNPFTEEALSRARGVLLSALLDNFPTAEAALAELLPRAAAVPFIYHPPRKPCPLWNLQPHS